MADSSITRIDDLLRSPSEPPITEADNTDTVGAIQDLLRGHGGTGLPLLSSANYGKFGKRTLQAINKFQKANNLTVEDRVSAAMLDKLVKVPATSPAATRVYLTRVLDQPLMGALKILSLVAIVEGGGRFAALAPNPDKAGLSLGIIQWAQRPGRLFELLDAWNKTDAAKMNRIFGGAARVEAILAHAKKGEAGLKADGTSNDPAVDLLSEDSRKRFREALLSPKFQAAQVGTALTAFADARRFLRTFATKIVSERGFAFMLDLANQHGLGGAKKIYTQAVKDTMTEGQAIQAMTEESVRRIAKQFPPKLGEKESVFTRGGRERREFYRDTPLLSDAPLGGGPPLPPPPP